MLGRGALGRAVRRVGNQEVQVVGDLDEALQDQLVVVLGRVVAAELQGREMIRVEGVRGRGRDGVADVRLGRAAGVVAAVEGGELSHVEMVAGVRRG